MIDLAEKQNIARENGKKSKGPVTPEGKQRSSLNGITHGLASKCVVLANESEELYTNLLAGYQSEWQPATLTEQNLVTEMANAYWRLRRIWSMETALFDSEMFCQKDGFEAAWSYHHPAMRVMDAVTAIHCAKPATLGTLHRYEIRYSRIHKGCISELSRLQRHRKRGLAKSAPLDLQPPQDCQHPPASPVSAETPSSTSWISSLLPFILSLLKALLSSTSVAKRAKTPRNAASCTSEPTIIPELPVVNFRLPEIFAWLSRFTPSSFRPGAESGHGKAEEPDAIA